MDSLTMCRPIAAIIVACLASFRQLFIKSEQAGLKKKSEGLQPCSGSLRPCFRSVKSMTTSGKRSLSSQDTDIERVFVSSQKLTDSKIPMDAIYIRRDVNIFVGDETPDMQETKLNHHGPWSLPPPSATASR